MHRRSARISLCLSSSLLIVLMHSTILVAMAVYHPRLLNTSNTMGVLTLKRHIHTQGRMGNVHSQPIMLVFKSRILSTSPS